MTPRDRATKRRQRSRPATTFRHAWRRRVRSALIAERTPLTLAVTGLILQATGIGLDTLVHRGAPVPDRVGVIVAAAGIVSLLAGLALPLALRGARGERPYIVYASLILLFGGLIGLHALVGAPLVSPAGERIPIPTPDEAHQPRRSDEPRRSDLPTMRPPGTARPSDGGGLTVTPEPRGRTADPRPGMQNALPPRSASPLPGR